MYNGAAWNPELLPGWHICDGTGGTPDLRERFIIGQSSNLENGKHGQETIPVIQHSHSVSGSTTSNGAHRHDIFCSGHLAGSPKRVAATALEDGGARFKSNTYNDGGHSHSISGTASNNTSWASETSKWKDYIKNYALIFIMRIE